MRAYGKVRMVLLACWIAVMSGNSVAQVQQGGKSRMFTSVDFSSMGLAGDFCHTPHWDDTRIPHGTYTAYVDVEVDKIGHFPQNYQAVSPHPEVARVAERIISGCEFAESKTPRKVKVVVTVTVLPR